MQHRTVYCVKLKKELLGLSKPPILPRAPELSQKIYDHISQEAWQAWLTQQTILINEQQLNTANPEHYQLLLTEMQKFLFNN